MTAEEKRPLLGELELDESYFGGKRKGKRGRGAAGKVAVFGILERDGKVYTVAVPNCKKETLMAKIEAATVKGSVFYTDEFTSYNDLSDSASTCRSTTGRVRRRRGGHINGIEGFWSYAKRLHRPCHGVDRENFPIYLAEYEFRYNNMDDHLLTILFDRLYRPIIEKGGCPRKSLVLVGLSPFNDCSADQLVSGGGRRGGKPRSPCASGRSAPPPCAAAPA